MAQIWYRKASVQTAVVSGAFLLIVTLVIQFSPKARLEKEVADLKGEIQRLETQLSPFRSVALQRFGGNEEEALLRLAAQLQDLQAQLERVAGTIRRFDVAAVATLEGDWKSATPPDLSKLLKTAARGSDIRAELKTNDAGMRWVDFTDSSGLKMATGEGGWILDYTAQAPPGSWVLGENRDDLQTCGGLEMTLYGIDRNATRDSIVTMTNLTLTFYVNGVSAFRCEYRPNFRVEMTEKHGSPVKVHLNGPVGIQQIR